MKERPDRSKQKMSLTTRISLYMLIVAIVGTLYAIFGNDIRKLFTAASVTPTATPFCMSAEDILVKFDIMDKNNQSITTLTPGETLSIEPGLTVYFQAKITSVYGLTLPTPKCTWTNTGIATEGKLLHVTGCIVDYQSGQKVITDAISLQISQPSCPALAPYPFFVSPK